MSVVPNAGKCIQALGALEASSKDTRNKHSSLSGPNVKSWKECLDGIRKIWDKRERGRGREGERERERERERKLFLFL